VSLVRYRLNRFCRSLPDSSLMPPASEFTVRQPSRLPWATNRRDGTGNTPTNFVRRVRSHVEVVDVGHLEAAVDRDAGQAGQRRGDRVARRRDGVRRADQRGELVPVQLAPPVVVLVGRVGERQHLADRIDPAELLAVLVDELDYFGSRGSSSRAKKADAALRISLARRSSRFSRSSSANRCASSVDVPGRWPVSTRLPDPIAKCLPIDPQLGRDRRDRTRPAPRLTLNLKHHPNRPVP
jgi:hypothetical protein